MTIKDKLMIYVYQKGCEIDNELEVIKLQCRHSPLDSLDHFELMHAQTRANAFKEFVDDIFRIIVNCK